MRRHASSQHPAAAAARRGRRHRSRRQLMYPSARGPGDAFGDLVAVFGRALAAAFGGACRSRVRASPPLDQAPVLAATVADTACASLHPRLRHSQLGELRQQLYQLARHQPPAKLAAWMHVGPLPPLDLLRHRNHFGRVRGGHRGHHGEDAHGEAPGQQGQRGDARGACLELGRRKYHATSRRLVVARNPAVARRYHHHPQPASRPNRGIHHCWISRLQPLHHCSGVHGVVAHWHVPQD
mmetsp:Transcript_31115/g.92684  ORF Transcript_31115/g.92684 Transcript_31115/m.92684 type:complete len:239 (+) Transcript_31115:632-1348(+)